VEETVFVSVIGLCERVAVGAFLLQQQRLPVSATALLFFLSGIISLA
jgi:hypothetical protein